MDGTTGCCVSPGRQRPQAIPGPEKSPAYPLSRLLCRANQLRLGLTGLRTLSMAIGEVAFQAPTLHACGQLCHGCVVHCRYVENHVLRESAVLDLARTILDGGVGRNKGRSRSIQFRPVSLPRKWLAFKPRIDTQKRIDATPIPPHSRKNAEIEITGT